jgi:hypothetical protein
MIWSLSAVQSIMKLPHDHSHFYTASRWSQVRQALHYIANDYTVAGWRRHCFMSPVRTSQLVMCLGIIKRNKSERRNVEWDQKVPAFDPAQIIWLQTHVPAAHFAGVTQSNYLLHSAPRFPKQHCFLKVHTHQPFVLW